MKTLKWAQAGARFPFGFVSPEFLDQIHHFPKEDKPSELVKSM